MHGTTLKARSADDRRHLLAILGASSLLALGMLAARFLYTGDGAYSFFVWNLFLAWLPLIFIGLAVSAPRVGQRRWAAAGWAFLWLLFFPNAPYLLTDLLHLGHGKGHPLPFGLTDIAHGWPAPAWYDALMFMTFAWNGLLLGFTSLSIFHRAVADRFGRRTGWIAAVVAIALASFGMSIGRFQRWNSWDILHRPLALLNDATWRVLAPWDHPRTTASTVSFAAFLLLAYLGLSALTRVHRAAVE